jgi:hypothetical protein
MELPFAGYRALVRMALLLALLVGLPVSPALPKGTSKLSGVMPGFGDVQDFKISPDGRFVVYSADQNTDGVVELFSAPLSGGTPVKLTPPLFDSIPQGAYLISPDSTRVVYKADQDTDNMYELYDVPIAGPASASVKLNRSLPPGSSVLDTFEISSDSTRVIYKADQDTAGKYELYSVPLTGPASNGVKLNGQLPIGANPLGYYQFTPDGAHVVYIAFQDASRTFELYSVPSAGPASAEFKLNSQLSDGDRVVDFQISSDNQRVIYALYRFASNGLEFHSVLFDSPLLSDTKINGVAGDGGAVVTFRISPDNTRVVYQAFQPPSNAYELYSVPIAGPADAGVKLNKPLADGGSVLEYRISPDSTRVIYYGDQDTDGVYELYSVPLAGPASNGVKLNKPLVAGGGIGSFLMGLDQPYVAYAADQDTANLAELYSVPMAGPSSAGVKLNGPLVAGGSVEPYSLQISTERRWIFYLADQQTDGTNELYVVPIHGPAFAGYKLNDSLTLGGSVRDYAVSPDGRRVVYRADQDTDEVFELYSAELRRALYIPFVQR